MSKTNKTSVLGKRLGYHVHKRRVRAGWTQPELARRAGMRDSQKVRELEKGLRSTDYDTVEQLARVFEVDAAKLFSLPLCKGWKE